MSDSETPPLNHTAGFGLREGKGYLLDSGHAGSQRLNYQYLIWKQCLGYTLHPRIRDAVFAAGDHPRIADITAGTGLWLLDTAHEFPNAILDGIDINLTRLPPAAWRPSNIHRLFDWNFYDEVPAELEERYDVIHLRLLLLTIANRDPGPVIRNVIKLLKPGGWIQWDDLSTAHTYVEKADSGLSTPALDKIREFVHSDGRHDWVFDLPLHLLKHGFEDCQLTFYHGRPDLISHDTEIHLMTITEFNGQMRKEGREDEARQIDDLVESAYEEAKLGAGVTTPRVVCVARKRPVPYAVREALSFS
jgi:SAM-dependent methyltransferase